MNNEHIDIIVEYGDRKGLNAGFLVQQFLSAKDKLTLEEMGEIKTIVADTRKRLRMAEFKFVGIGETISILTKTYNERKESTMKMQDGELKVYYKGLLDPELDQALEKCLAKFGYERWASGTEIDAGIRDLAFDKSGLTNTERIEREVEEAAENKTLCEIE